MIAQTATTSMKDWINSGWIITSLHYLAGLPPPPPAATGDLSGGLKLTGFDTDWEEFIDDLTAAQLAAEQYEAKGIEHTIPYSEYRARRLRTGS